MPIPFLRYPGSKRRFLAYLADYLPHRKDISGRHVEPFVGGGAVFLFMHPKRALLSDINQELIDLYRGIRQDPLAVWNAYRATPDGKAEYQRIRGVAHHELNLTARAARLLYLNRTCFKGMWRHNSRGMFNVGYGGQSRRWVITEQDLIDISRRLRRAALRCADFESIIDSCQTGDFVFADPPYRPGHIELANEHYVSQAFGHADQKRLASALRRLANRGIPWALTNTAHPEILDLYHDFRILSLPRGTGAQPGSLTQEPREAIIISK